MNNLQPNGVTLLKKCVWQISWRELNTSMCETIIQVYL